MTAEDVRNTTFEKVMRGYRVEDVDAFIGQIADEMDKLAAQKADADNKLRILALKVEEYRGQEETLKTALINAQRMGETVVYEARQRAEGMLREAEGQTDLLRQQASREYAEQRTILAQLKEDVTAFRTQLLELYSHHLAQMKALDGTAAEADAILDKYPMKEEPLLEKEPEAEPAAPPELEEEDALPAMPVYGAPPLKNAPSLDLFGEEQAEVPQDIPGEETAETEEAEETAADEEDEFDKI